MEQYKQEFIEFMVESNVLKFGDFTLKSGRKSPFFMNAGAYVTGTQLRKLGEYYAKAIHDNFGLDFDVLFGPAYKGIPLSVATTMAISELYGKDIRYCSNRKEVKDHGDTGILLGSPIKDGDRVMIIEDVTTSGKSIEETFPILKAQGDVEIKGLIVSLNRMERGKGTKSALDEIKDLYGFPTAAIVTMADVTAYGKDIRYCSNRKEVKDHGDTGILLGSPIKDGDRVMIIEDVTTSGKSIEETFPILKAQGDVEIKGLIVSLNRMERGKGTKSALDEIKDLYGFPTAAIVTMADVTEYLYNKECGGKIVINDTLKAAIDAYYAEYGAQA